MDAFAIVVPDLRGNGEIRVSTPAPGRSATPSGQLPGTARTSWTSPDRADPKMNRMHGLHARDQFFTHGTKKPERENRENFRVPAPPAGFLLGADSRELPVDGGTRSLPPGTGVFIESGRTPGSGRPEPATRCRRRNQYQASGSSRFLRARKSSSASFTATSMAGG